jgi:hypothetical protein
MNDKSSMHRYLVHLLNTAEKPGEAAVMLQFKSPTPPIQGALRLAEIPGVDDIFELLAIGQNGPQGQPFPVHNFFTADEVSRVMTIGSAETLPKIVRPASAGGILVPT